MDPLGSAPLCKQIILAPIPCTRCIRSKDAPNTIAGRIVELASDMQKEETKVSVSSLIPRNDSNELDEKTKAVNAELKQMCSRRNVDIIEHLNLNRNIHVNGNVLKNWHLCGTSLQCNNHTYQRNINRKLVSSLSQNEISLKAGFHLNECNESAEAARVGACVVGSNVDSPAADLGRIG